MQPGLHQLAQSAAADGQVPGWDNALGLWTPIDVVRGLTSDDASVTVTDNGDGTLDLAAAGGGSSFSGYVPLGLAPGYASVPGGTATPTGQGKAVPIMLPGPMKCRGLVIETSATGTGTVQWGLFNASSNPAAATKVAGGSGTLSATGATMIAASSPPVAVAAGAYILVALFPATNCPGVNRATATTSPPWNRVWTSYTWSDTPDLTSGSWAASNTVLNWYLKGDVDASSYGWW